MEMASSSGAKQITTRNGGDLAGANYVPYPTALVRYEDVVMNPRLFMETLEKLHSTLGTKFMIPIIGGKDLDLHRLFVEVTSRGGIEKIMKERRWKEVTTVFNFPSTATNASFVLRKYYMSLLYHFEQIYFFKAQGWVPSTDPLRNVSHSPQIAQVSSREQPRNSEFPPAATSETGTGSQVIGVIDGKFESGYLVSVTIGSEKLKGVLYSPSQEPSHVAPRHQQIQNVCTSSKNAMPSTGFRRRRRKKCEMKKRDPAHPKPNRSGYNFFFAEQHARLKPLYTGKDREISRMIGELWTNIKEPDKVVYQEKAAKDKERYIREMGSYKERLRTGGGQIISNAVPIQQLPLDANIDIAAGQPSEGTDDLDEVSSKSSIMSDAENHKLLDEEEEESFDLDNVKVANRNENEENEKRAEVGDESLKDKESRGDSEERRKRAMPDEEKEGLNSCEKRHKTENE